MNLKSELTCNICKLVLNNPVMLPCSSLICGEHMRNGTIKENSIRCLACGKDFDVSRSGFTSNELATNILAKELHLSEEEKRIKHEIKELIKQMEHLQADVIHKQSIMKVTSYDHFAEICRQIDTQREELKAQIDQIALKLIAQVKEREKGYNEKLNEIVSSILDADIRQNSLQLFHVFRQPNLLIADAKRLQDEFEHKLKERMHSNTKYSFWVDLLSSLFAERTSCELL